MIMRHANCVVSRRSSCPGITFNDDTTDSGLLMQKVKDKARNEASRICSLLLNWLAIVRRLQLAPIVALES